MILPYVRGHPAVRPGQREGKAFAGHTIALYLRFREGFLGTGNSLAQIISRFPKTPYQNKGNSLESLSPPLILVLRIPTVPSRCVTGIILPNPGPAPSHSLGSSSLSHLAGSRSNTASPLQHGHIISPFPLNSSSRSGIWGWGKKRGLNLYVVYYFQGLGLGVLYNYIF